MPKLKLPKQRCKAVGMGGKGRCPNLFRPKRPEANYCSAVCRQRAFYYRFKKKHGHSYTAIEGKRRRGPYAELLRKLRKWRENEEEVNYDD